MYNIHDSDTLFSERTKSVARELEKVSVGRVAARGRTWFPELTDKSMC